jgi:hypothetical protein
MADETSTLMPDAIAGLFGTCLAGLWLLATT